MVTWFLLESAFNSTSSFSPYLEYNTVTTELRVVLAVFHVKMTLSAVSLITLMSSIVAFASIGLAWFNNGSSSFLLALAGGSLFPFISTFVFFFPPGWSWSDCLLALVVIAMILVLRVVVEETMEEKGREEKEAVEGGDKVEVEREEEEDEEKEDQEANNEVGIEVDLPNFSG
jgi:hypothetical protein